jgi:hypothetical protein
MLRIIPYVLVLLGCTYHSSSSPTPPGAGRKALAARQSPPPGDTLGDSGPGVSSKVWVSTVFVGMLSALNDHPFRCEDTDCRRIDSPRDYHGCI